MKTTMPKHLILLFAGATLLLAGLACSAGSAVTENTLDVTGTLESVADEIGTLVVQTAEAALTNTAVAGGGGQGAATAAETSATTPTATLIAPTSTPLVTATATLMPTGTLDETGCRNNSIFVADVNFPDDTIVGAGDTFTKTWRIHNNGSCTWTTAYSFVFIEGAQLGDAPSVSVIENVSPGADFEVSVTFTAPSANGTYSSVWQLRTSDGTLFGTRPYVRIRVRQPTATVAGASTQVSTSTGTAVGTKVATSTGTQAATATATSTPTPTVSTTSAASVTVSGPVTVTIDYTEGLSAQISSSGTVLAAPHVGDTSGNNGLQGFVTFDLSSIPVGATITKVELDLSPFDTVGSPFANLGCLRVYSHSFGTPEANDYFTGNAVGANWRFCNTGQLSDSDAMTAELLTTIQDAIGGNYQIRLQFNQAETNSDNQVDTLRPSPSLIITYS